METVTPEAVGLSTARVNRIERAMQAHIDQGRFPGIVTMVARRGRIAHAGCFGWLDVDAARPMVRDAIFRIASMTKPVTSVAVMMLYEEGHFQLTDPIAEFIPAFHNSQVYAGGSGAGIELVDADRPITIADLLIHLSGLGAGDGDDAPLKAMYQSVRQAREQLTLAALVQELARLPLLHQPGQAWHYGYSYEVLARLVELVSGQPLADFLRQRIFEPLDMPDTGFHLPREKAYRLTTAYGQATNGKWPALDSPASSSLFAPPTLTSGSGNLLSTAPDYARFAQMLLNGGELDGVRLLGRKTVELMTANHLHGELLPMRAFPGSDWRAYGFGLGFRILLDVAQSQISGSVGEYCWAGYWSTHFWVDPREALIGIHMTQVGPPYYFPEIIPPDFKVLVYQAIVD